MIVWWKRAHQIPEDFGEVMRMEIASRTTSLKKVANFAGINTPIEALSMVSKKARGDASVKAFYEDASTSDFILPTIQFKSLTRHYKHEG